MLHFRQDMSSLLLLIGAAPCKNFVSLKRVSTVKKKSSIKVSKFWKSSFLKEVNLNMKTERHPLPLLAL